MSSSFDTKPEGDVATTCPYCGVGCGVIATPDGHSGAIVRGDSNHPANYGRLCSKGSALGETLDLEERLLHPKIDGRRSDWDTALDLVARRFTETIATYGPDSVAFYVSGQLLTEDYYVANKLMKGVIGSANIDTNSRLCMASSVVGHKRAFGADTVPGRYSDLELADLVILVGSNFAWCHPVLHQRLLAAKAKRGTRIVVIDPRKTATCDAADLHLAIKPGTDVMLFNALLEQLVKSSAFDADYVQKHTSGLGDALGVLDGMSLGQLADATGLAIEDLQTFFKLAVNTPRMMTVYSQGVNQSTSGVDKVNSIINCHLATGRIGKPGMGPFSITGQPNAMGGREVGGLANQLAAHMDFAKADVDRVRRFWNTTKVADKPGLKAVDLFDAVADGRLKAIWIMATNPVISMPKADEVKAALEACPFVVVSDVVSTSDTLKLGHVQLPATAWGEKTGTVTNSERCISRQRSFLKPPGEARHDWDIISDVARRMGAAGFDYDNEASIFREYATMTAFENGGRRDLDLGAYADIDRETFDALTPFYWPAPADAKGVGERFFAEGNYYTPDGLGKFIPTPYKPPASKVCDRLSLVMNTGRVRDHWHTMTRTGKTARLSSHIGEPYIEIHPSDATTLNVKPASLVKVSNTIGEAVLRVVVTDRMRQGEVFAPFHWTSRYASAGRVDTLVQPNVDELSGQPEAKYTPVKVSALEVELFGFVLCLEEPDDSVLSNLAYWAKARTSAGWILEFACSDDGLTADRLVQRFVGENVSQSFQDKNTGRCSGALFDKEERLSAIALVGAEGPLSADRGWLSMQLGTIVDLRTRQLLLSGRPPIGEGEGRTVCSCMGVGINTIIKAIAAGASSVETLGACTKAGTNCGSCKPELAVLLQDHQLKGISEAVAAE